MQDDSPWMPPTSGASPSGDESESPPPADAVSPWSRDAVAPPVPAPAGPGPVGPVLPASPWSANASASMSPADMPTVPTLPDAPPAVVPAPSAWPAQPVAAVSPPELDPVGPAAAPTRARRSKVVVGGAVAAVLAVGGAGVFAVSSFTGSDPGGAATPEELGLDLLAAIENEDVLGIVDLMAPGERDVLRQPLLDVVSELTRLDVLSPEADLSNVLGIDIELTGEIAEPKPTNVDDITNVELRAEATATFDGAKVPLGDLITDNLSADQLTQLRGTTETDVEPLDGTLTAIQQDGRWYFSAFHTLAEQAREDEMPDSPIPTVGLGADGADSPEAAVDQLFDRVQALDLSGLIRTLNPGEAAALQRYAPLFVDEAQAELDRAPIDWRITDREVRIEGDGDTRTVFVDALAIEGTFDGSAFEFSFDGDCVKAAAEGETMEQCVGDVASGSVEEIFGQMPAVMHLFDTVTAAFADLEPAGLELRRTDGEWYVSPTATVTEAMLNVLRALDRSELDAIIDAVPPAIEEFFGDMFGGGLDDDFVFGEPTEPFPIEEDSFDVGSGEATSEEAAIEESGAEGGDWYGCFDESDPDAAAACLEEFAATGQIDRSVIPAVLRFPECGFTQGWYGNHTGLPDDEFIALATAAQPCFQALIDDGQVEEWELPDEITHLECFEGRNLYMAFDDPEYTERAFACISGE